MPNIYHFDHDHIAQWGKPPKELKSLLGGKGANLAEMTTVLNLPVPHGFTITTDACQEFLAGGWNASLEDEIDEAIATVEAKMNKTFGSGPHPLLLSVRSGAKFSMPGMMDTVLNLGLNQNTVEALAEKMGSRRFAWDSYRRFISMYGRIVHGIDSKVFDTVDKILEKTDGPSREWGYSSYQTVTGNYLQEFQYHTGKTFPTNVRTQLLEAVKAVFESWNGDRAKIYREAENIPHDIGTAVNVQSMVFGNLNDNSGTGVAFTRNPVTGVAEPYGDFLPKAQGEDVVAGTHTTLPLSNMIVGFSGNYTELKRIFNVLEKHYEDMCDVEFTIETGKLWILQTRVGKRADTAALRMAVDMTQGYLTDGWSITRAESANRVRSIVESSPVKKVQTTTSETFTHIAEGLAASPGVASGKVVFTADKAVEMTNSGEKVILVREETSPDDIHGMQVSEGILTAVGGLVSHAAVVARGWNIPAVVGASSIAINLDVDGWKFATESLVINEGDTITIDGSTGKVYPGIVSVAGGNNDGRSLEILREWVKKVPQS